LTQITGQPENTVALGPVSTGDVLRARLTDYKELTKPRITLMVVITAAIGYALGLRVLGLPWNMLGMMWCLVGTALSCMGASALNQALEKVTDARMQRTAARPVASGRVSVAEATLLGLAIGALGVILLAALGNYLAAGLSFFTIFSYCLIYTPSKRLTSLSTIIGAVPGAMPPMIGFAAATGTLTLAAWSVFGIMFLWQLPHFLAIAWMYREDYGKAGMPMLPVLDPTGGSTFRQMLATSAMLLPLGMMPTALGVAGWVYFAVATLAGLGFCYTAVRLVLTPSQARAKAVFYASLIYLPLVLAVLTFDPA